MIANRFNPGTNEELKALSDEKTLELSIKHPDSFGELVNRYERPLFRKALSLLGSEDDASDAVQETFARIYAAAKRFRTKEGASFSSWAYAILVNRCRTIYGKNKKAGKISLEHQPELSDMIPDEDAATEHEKMLVREYVLCLLSKLPELLRRVVAMHFLDETPTRKIAEILGISNGAVRARIHRAKKTLRNVYNDMENGGNGILHARIGPNVVRLAKVRLTDA